MAAVLDASALLALILGEPGQDTVRAAIRAGAGVCSVNVAEIGAALVRRGFPFGEVSARIRGLPIATIDFDLDLALATASMFPQTRRTGLSLGDRACLALARRDGVAALSADRAWSSIAEAVGVVVQIIR